MSTSGKTRASATVPARQGNKNTAGALEIQVPAAQLPVYVRHVGPGTAPGLGSSEWLLADGAGGFAMGTAAGAPTRRYHAWLIAATTPPVGRVAMLSSCAEWLVESAGTQAERRHDLSTFIFPNTRAPHGEKHLVRFEVGIAARWTYEVPTSAGTTRVNRELTLRRQDERASGAACFVRYTIENAPQGARLLIRPLVSMRDFHGLLKGRDCPDRFAVAERDGGVCIDVGAKYGPLAPGGGDAANPTLCLEVAGALFSNLAQWWYDFEYPVEAARGQDCREDLFSPGEFAVNIEPRSSKSFSIELRAWTGAALAQGATFGDEIARETLRQSQLADAALRTATAGPPDVDLSVARSRLAAAADRFVVRRELEPTNRASAGSRAASSSIIAGYPWFSDWGRDTMICLPGLMLATGRFEEARKTLSTFAALCKDGLIPNWFDNAGHAEYNTVDAALWFVHAACRYAEAAGDRAIFTGEVGKSCRQIIAAYRAGTHHGIRMDEDGLITAGDAGTQLTWMDAKRDGVIFTPRFGKAVEINSLWYNAIRSLAALPEDKRETSDELNTLADRVRDSFRSKFWNPLSGCLYDVLVPEQGTWRPDARTRPNQIFAVSLPHSPLTNDQQTAVVECVRRRLLTPLGLRTLFPGDPGYIGRFRGNLFERDRAYHNGTVWPWLLGPLAEATMRVHSFSKDSRREAFELLRPLLSEFDSPRPGRLLGQLAEVYDGDDRPDEPREPGGCPAQAWSVAEALRVLSML